MIVFLCIICIYFSLLIVLSVRMEKSYLEDIERKRVQVSHNNLTRTIDNFHSTYKKLLLQLKKKNKLIAIFAHSVKGSLRFLPELALSAKYKVKSIDYKGAKKDLKLLHKGITATYEMTSDVLAWVKMGWKTNNKPEEQDLKKIVEKVLVHFEEEIRQKDIIVKNTQDKNYKVLALPGSIELILSNILSNALKYAKSLITIHVSNILGTKVRLAVKDNGEGFNEENIIDKLNRDEIIVSTPGRHGELGTGVGLMIIKDLAEQNSVELNFINSSSGLTVELVFDLYKC